MSENLTVVGELERLQKENILLRAALATSKDPCVYCQLPAEEMAKCRAGFPGCARADDLMGCPERGAALEVHFAQQRITRLETALRKIAAIEYNYLGPRIAREALKEDDGLDHNEPWEPCCS